VGTQVHTSPAQFGKVMSHIKPRMAVGYHFFNDFDTQPNVEEQVRSTYDGPLALAVDYMVFNVTKKNIKVRMAVIDEDIWPQPAVGKKLPPDASKRIGFSKFITSGRVPYKDVVDKIYSDINKKFGTNIPTPK
jgi:ribonuclease Z